MDFEHSNNNEKGFFSRLFTKESPTSAMKGVFRFKFFFIVIIVVCIIATLV